MTKTFILITKYNKKGENDTHHIRIYNNGLIVREFNYLDSVQAMAKVLELEEQGYKQTY